jgi:hypothetical protein
MVHEKKNGQMCIFGRQVESSQVESSQVNSVGSFSPAYLFRVSQMNDQR